MFIRPKIFIEAKAWMPRTVASLITNKSNDNENMWCDADDCYKDI